MRVLNGVPADRSVHVSVEGVHVLLGQLEIEHLGVLDDASVGHGLGKRNVSLLGSWLGLSGPEIWKKK